MSTYREGTTPGWADEPWVPEPTPPAVTLEEHVARAIASARNDFDNSTTMMARAAIAAVREWDGAEIELLREENEALNLRAGICYSGSDMSSIRESERAACEAIARDVSRGWGSDAAHAIADAIAARKDKGDGK